VLLSCVAGEPTSSARCRTSGHTAADGDLECRDDKGSSQRLSAHRGASYIASEYVDPAMKSGDGRDGVLHVHMQHTHFESVINRYRGPTERSRLVTEAICQSIRAREDITHLQRSEKTVFAPRKRLTARVTGTAIGPSPPAEAARPRTSSWYSRPR